jgi:hypothetical protein
MMKQGLNYEQRCEMEWVWKPFDQEEAALRVWAVNLTEVSSTKRRKERSVTLNSKIPITYIRSTSPQ